MTGHIGPIISALILTIPSWGNDVLVVQQPNGTSFASTPGEATTKKNSTWMSRLQDGLSLSELSLPGTHDTCALHNGLSFGFAKCQAWSLEDQLKAGVRFLDIRCRHAGDRFQIHHGVIDQRITFIEVRDICRRFLNRHPSECIVMSVKEESTPSRNSRSFSKTFRHLIRNDENLWYIDKTIPDLKQVRKRIVLVDRVGTLGGLPWKKMVLQDDYMAQMDRKVKLVRTHLEKAIRGAPDYWHINFCSGTIPKNLITPREYAVQLNAAVLQFLQQLKPTRAARIGTVVLDFPGEDLIEAIVETNLVDRD